MGQLTLFQEQMNDFIAQGGGEELMAMTPEELRRAIDAYLDKGPDFLKFGGTSHFSEPTFIGFSAEAQKVIVDEAHTRNRAAETHSTSIEGLRLSIAAGIDGIQHPELLDGRAMPDDLVRIIVDRGLNCSMLASTITGPAWTRHLKSKAEVRRKRAEGKAEGEKAEGKKVEGEKVEGEKVEGTASREQTSAERRKEAAEEGADLEMRRANAQKLIRAGCRVTPGTDSYWAAAPEFTRTPKPPEQDHGIGTIMAVEGLVELGMSPSQALVAATRNGAEAARRLKDFGTIETGKLADLVMLTADPLADIGNLRKGGAVMKDGQIVDRARLPQTRVLSVAPPPAAPGTKAF
jgi:imidazolonepropionase-like amidohydrolase